MEREASNPEADLAKGTWRCRAVVLKVDLLEVGSKETTLLKRKKRLQMIRMRIEVRRKMDVVRMVNNKG
ncbi:hypothetical protein SLEP1_g18353 [Rubroshorea leprosula]|uniref:Uncharacterized protein n=1 Tax=Rubroshorea leprosula TaxID=152421 RepID=A0AAV5J6D8_9ROSI|nr:hypothetical protein SLEP1_g18353 [Rubroshorea leprosula]